MLNFLETGILKTQILGKIVNKPYNTNLSRFISEHTRVGSL